MSKRISRNKCSKNIVSLVPEAAASPTSYSNRAHAVFLVLQLCGVRVGFRLLTFFGHMKQPVCLFEESMNQNPAYRGMVCMLTLMTVMMLSLMTLHVSIVLIQPLVRISFCVGLVVVWGLYSAGTRGCLRAL